MIVSSMPSLHLQPYLCCSRIMRLHRRLDLADGGLTRGPPPAARQQRMGRPAALGASVSWDGASSRSLSRFTHDSGIGSPRDEAGETSPDGGVDSRPSGCGSSNSAVRARCEIEPIDSDDDGDGSTAGAQQDSRGASAEGGEEQVGHAAPSRTEHCCEGVAPGSGEPISVPAPVAVQPRGSRTISRVGLRAAADPRWRTDPRRMAAVRELLRGRARQALDMQGSSDMAADAERAVAAHHEATWETTAADLSQQPSDLDAIGAWNDLRACAELLTIRSRCLMGSAASALT